MNKRILSLIFMFLCFNTANALDTTIFLGLTGAKVDGENYSQITIGQTTKEKFDNNVIVGFANSINYGTINSNSVTTYDLDLKLGYQLTDELRAYILGTTALQTYDNTTYHGFGYGASVEYKVNKNFALEVLYKEIDMKKSDKKYTYNTSGLAIKLSF
ncbi:porin family protein [Arcobacter porcinus]|uniref:Porin family protein n=1 Tax=Arcobacter porcinus TaxID=1935204 RepID=A0A1C0AUV9_9BACT|nr:hypothetical protein [Arcobacter porcinus]OCL96619.1 hypothetical protein AAX27_00669 [Aliarcobacter thereius]OCL83659.1 hypothetical protein AAW30_00897 [Arcobacter porcinus]OCL83878.1 hypothetical protein AAW29_00709 [Arcobacter porcinus]OCL89969.1 hypothetical protein AAX28_01927 [Arcobacter porcinus]QEP41131.1 porin family protein [Arcobacter porcinus]